MKFVRLRAVTCLESDALRCAVVLVREQEPRRRLRVSVISQVWQVVLEGLKTAVIPVVPLLTRMNMKCEKGDKIITRTVVRRQFPIGTAYGFTDYGKCRV
jgi:hypothetical protein